jgi:hypothetical protein
MLCVLKYDSIDNGTVFVVVMQLSNPSIGSHVVATVVEQYYSQYPPCVVVPR